MINNAISSSSFCPVISVILTSYNHAKYIKEAIDSVLNQTFADFELLIWDDCSSDESWKIIQSYSDYRIKSFQTKENTYCGYINEAIKQARGKYIAIQHSDDIWELDKLEKQVAFLEKNPEVGAVFTNVQAIGEEGNPLPQGSHSYCSIFNQENRTRHQWLRHFFESGNALCHPSVLIQKICYEKVGYYNIQRGLAQLPDFDMWIRLCFSYDIHILREKLIKFRVRDNESNTSGNRPETRKRVTLESYLLLQNYCHLSSFEELIMIFPEAAEYNRGKNSVITFALAKVSLGKGKEKNLFAISLLVDLISNPKDALKIKEFYDFDYRDVIKITGIYDSFFVEGQSQINTVEFENTRKEIKEIYSEETKSKVVKLQNLLLEKELVIIQKNELIASQQVQLLEKDREIFRLISCNELIKASWSWRLTFPFRLLQDNGVNFISRMFYDCYNAVFIKFFKKNYNFKNSEITTANKVEESKLVNSLIPITNFEVIQEGFIPYLKKERKKTVVKAIAFYLPQFHPFKENDIWWGKGFTEWTNVGKAKPIYEGHYQPHCPIHFGYYDLRIPSIMEEQAALATEYGIYGFNYYFYWFNGKTIMEEPLKMMLDNPKVDIPFCLTWANENWTRKWDGDEQNVLIRQHHSIEDSRKFIQHLIPYFRDKRYITIEDKPILIVYRANIIPNIKETARLWRDEIVRCGFKGIYLIAAQTFGISSPHEFDFDASMEFPPHGVQSGIINNELYIKQSDFKGSIYSYPEVVKNQLKSVEKDYKCFNTIMLSWDNTSRRGNSSNIFHGFSLNLYNQWLSWSFNKVNNDSKYSLDEKIVFINAWNEWAEGTHLEPDQQYGYGYLEATRRVVENFDELILKTTNNQSPKKPKKFGVIVHLHYTDLWDEIKLYLENFQEIPFDLYITVTNSSIIPNIVSSYPNAIIDIVENRGRDILPFIKILQKIKNINYTAVCKIHSKKSFYRSDGGNIRSELLKSLLGSHTTIVNHFKQFELDQKLGLIIPALYCISYNAKNMFYNYENTKKLLEYLHIQYKEDACFPAGSMFWFRPQALNLLLGIQDSFFELEDGYADGKIHHAVERIFCLVCEAVGYKINKTA